MARSAHAYLRGSPGKFYEWLVSAAGKTVPEGPAIWICGDCHVGNLGPVANLKGGVNIQIRDLDQTVIGNPAHDLIRLGLSLATAARSADRPGITTARMMEEMVVGYCAALAGSRRTPPGQSDVLAGQRVMEHGFRQRWRNEGEERIADMRASIPRSENFWDLTARELSALQDLVASDEVRKLVSSLHRRDDNAKIKMLDAAYWVKGSSSLGRLRYAVLVGTDKERRRGGARTLLDIKEATTASAPRVANAPMPRDHAERVVTGTRALAPDLGKRMLATKLNEHSVVLRELLPQDLKLEIERLTQREAINAARFLASVIGEAHARQMDRSTRRSWLTTLQQKHSATLDAPSWFWSSVVELVARHEAAYLEHCRRYQNTAA